MRGEAMGDVFVSRFHHDPDHLFGSRGTQQDSTGITQIVSTSWTAV